MMRPVTGSAFGRRSSGCRGSGAVGSHGLTVRNLARLHFGGRRVRARHVVPARLVVASGGFGHLPLHAGQPGGAPAVGQTRACTRGSWDRTFESSHGSRPRAPRRASADRESRPSPDRTSRAGALLEVDGQLVLAGVAATGRVDADEVLALRVRRSVAVAHARAGCCLLGLLRRRRSACSTRRTRRTRAGARGAAAATAA